MRKRFLILVALGVMFTPSVVEAKDTYKVSYSYDSNGGAIEVSQKESKDNSIKIKVKNKSDMDIHDLKLYSSKDTRFVLTDSSVYVGEVKAGDERVISVKAYDWGSGSIQRYINDVGGLQAFVPLFVLGISGVFFLVFVGKNKKLCYVQVMVALVAGMLFVSSDLPSNSKGSEVTVHLEDYMQIKGEDVKWSGVLNFYEDTFTTEDISEEETIPFETEYTLDEDVKVTEDPVIEQEGRNGKRVKTYEIRYLNGEEISRELVRDAIDIEPQNKKITQGTLSVVKKESIPPEKVYIPDDGMLLGESEKDEELTGLQDKTGESETKYFWDSTQKKVCTSESIIKKPGKEYYRAGTLKVVESVIQAKIQYSPVDNQEVGYEKVIKDKQDGSLKKYFRVDIDVKTGKEKKDSEEYFVKSEREEAIDGKIEIGVLKTEEVNKGFKTVEEPVEDQWTNYREVVQEGKDKIVIAKTALNLNENTGICSETGTTTEEIKEEGQDEIVRVGTKEPNWVSQIELGKEISYNTVFVPCEDGSLTGNDQKVITQGENGRIFSEYLVACDNEGNELDGYEKRLVSKDNIQDPVNEVIMVAEDSIALDTPQGAASADGVLSSQDSMSNYTEKPVKGSLTQRDMDDAEKMTALALFVMIGGLALRLLPRRRYKSVLKARERKELGGAEISEVIEKVTLGDREEVTKDE